MGNKKELSESDKNKIAKLIAFGLPMKNVAAVFDMNVRTLERRVKEDHELARIIDKARLECDFRVVETAYHKAVSGEDTRMTIFWLKTRLGWRERITHEHELVKLEDIVGPTFKRDNVIEAEHNKIEDNSDDDAL